MVDHQGDHLRQVLSVIAAGTGDYSRDRGRLLDALELRSAILVGHSMGGLWSLRFTLTRPERVTGLAILGARHCLARRRRCRSD